MKQISLREFQLHPTQHLQSLPIVLTQYNKPIATIIPHANTSVNTNIKPQESVNTSVTEPQEESKWPTYYLGKPLSGKKASCPICYESIPTEFAQQHYSKEHGDI